VTDEDNSNLEIDINDFDWSPYVVSFADENTGMGFGQTEEDIHRLKKARGEGPALSGSQLLGLLSWYQPLPVCLSFRPITFRLRQWSQHS